MPTLLDPLKLPSLPLSGRRNLPHCTAIYLAIDAQDRILYIGKARNLAARWKNHHRLYNLEELDKNSPVRLAWQSWSEDDLSEAEKALIENFHPLLNNTKIEYPKIIPSEITLRDFLKKFSRRLIIFGINPKTPESLANVYLKYDWRNCSPAGTAAKIREYIKEVRDKNINLKFRRHAYSAGSFSRGIIFRPGSREHKSKAREHRSFNNHWEFACNGVVFHITPALCYSDYKGCTQAVRLAGVKFQALTQNALSLGQKSPDRFSEGLSCFVNDPVPLLWKNYPQRKL
ncbi:GIY-YIG nuclease family protein [Nodosilinea sp. PGN35]|nr:GIY-YIG nuclease family protein [Nodosilinea sp. TSF1-S3]MDF0365382.1 GIY-YIG nuclease family protein [Nodosilinea sp. TSF1-S3]